MHCNRVSIQRYTVYSPLLGRNRREASQRETTSERDREGRRDRAMTYIWPTGHRVELLIQFALKHSHRFISFRLFYHFRDHFPSRRTCPISSFFQIYLSDWLIRQCLHVVWHCFLRRCPILWKVNYSSVGLWLIRWKVERYRRQNQSKFVRKTMQKERKKEKQEKLTT